MIDNDDWSKRIGDKWGLSWCREDRELHGELAPWYPIRRLYLRLCHDPSVGIMPPGFISILFCFLAFYGFVDGVVHGEMPLYLYPFYLLVSWLVAVVIGFCLDIFLLLLLPIWYLVLENVFGVVDILLFHPCMRWQRFCQRWRKRWEADKNTEGGHAD